MDHGSHNMDMTSTTAMPSSTGMSDHDGMSHDSGHMGMSMSMADMAMTFFASGRTPLFSDVWTPNNDGVYAGTCIFLIVLGLILRVLLALRPILEARFWSKDTPTAVSSPKGSGESNDALTRQPSRALGAILGDIRSGWRGWMVRAAAARATYELTIAGVGYLLMIAVMTMNVGHFMSVLAGIWLGTFVLGGLSNDDRNSHC